MDMPIRWEYEPLFMELPDDFRRDVRLVVRGPDFWAAPLMEITLQNVTYDEVQAAGASLFEMAKLMYEESR